MNATKDSMIRLATLGSALLALAACSGGGGGGDASAPPSGDNTPPSIAGLTADVTIPQDASSEPIRFNVSDAESEPGAIQVEADSSNPEILSADGIALSGPGQARTLVLTPEEGAHGLATITLRARDADGLMATSAISVTVTTVERSFKEMVQTAFAKPADGSPEETRGFTWVDDPQDDPRAFDHLLRR